MEPTSIHFATAARVLGEAARKQGLIAPSFRSPPRVAADRTLRRRGSLEATVAVRVRGRPWLAVLGDLVEGVVMANQLRGADADRCRTELWAEVEAHRLAVPLAAETSSATVAASPGWRKRQTQAA